MLFVVVVFFVVACFKFSILVLRSIFVFMLLFLVGLFCIIVLFVGFSLCYPGCIGSAPDHFFKLALHLVFVFVLSSLLRFYISFLVFGFLT